MMKYSYKDFSIMLNAFATIEQNKTNTKIVYSELMTLIDYPIEVVKVFVDTMTQLANKNMKVTQDNYYGIAGLVIMKMNVADPDFVL